jgi:tetratricopeptide (TPR) repeat protein
MTSPVEDLIESLRSFLAQDDHHVLVIEANDDAAALLPGAFAAIGQHARGMTVPFGGDDEVAALLEQLPSHGVLGLTLCPVTVEDPVAWEKHVRELVSREVAWQSRVRWIVRTPGSELTIASALWVSFEVSHETLAAHLEQTAGDVELTDTQRLSALQQLAWIDLPHGSCELAIERFGVLFDAYTERDDQPMASLCLQGIGAAHRMQGNAAEALVWFQRSIAVSLPGGASTVLLGAFLGAGDCSYENALFEDAEKYFVEAARVAGVLRGWVSLCEALEKAGVAALARGDSVCAASYWERCRGVATKMNDDPRSSTVLERLQSLYSEVGLHVRAHEVYTERAALQQEAS